MYSKLFEYDTEIFADSVEAIPNNNDGLFLSGTYQLDETTRLRNGKITLHQLTGDDNKVNTYDSLKTSGVLDMKFNPEEVGEKHTLAIALSDGYLTLQQLDIGNEFKNIWTENESLLVEDESTICLSVDWNNQMIANPNPSIAISLSNGKMAICQRDEDALVVREKWNAHSLSPGIPAEVWITSFDPQNPDIVYSGGDDGIMKQWDLRMVGSYAFPTAVSKDFEAGVTSMCWNKYDAQYLTVGSYDGHVRIFDTRAIQHPVSDFNVEHDAGIWRIKYKHNSNYYLHLDKHDEIEKSPTRNEFLLAAMRAGFIVMDYNANENRTMSPKVTYLEQGTESLPYGVDYVYKNKSNVDNPSGYVASCSFYNHLMHVWKYDYSCVCSHTLLFELFIVILHL